MKVCPNCNNTVEDNVSVCNRCGTFLAAQNAPGNNPQYNQTQYQPAPQTPPKKKNTGKIIGIVAVVLIVLAIIGSVAQKAFQDQGYGDSGNNNDTPAFNADSDNTTTNNNFSDVKTYTKGAVVDNWYVNEWAGIRFDTTGWTIGTAEEYAAYESDPNTECGIILNDDANNKQFDISFEKLSGTNALLSETDYLDILTKKIQQGYAAENISCIVSEYSDKTIAGETYKTVRVSLNDGIVIQDYNVRKLDGYIIFFCVTVQDGFDASSIINNIKTVD